MGEREDGDVAAVAVASCWTMLLRVGRLVAAGSHGGQRRKKKKQHDREGRRRKEEEEKHLVELMSWVTDRIDQAGRVPPLSDVVEQAGKGFGFRGLSRCAISAALRRHPYYQFSSHQVNGPRHLGLH